MIRVGGSVSGSIGVDVEGDILGEERDTLVWSCSLVPVL